jgi:fatty-acyl-CoA synthase
LNFSTIARFVLEVLLPLLAWSALIVVIVRWHFRRWEIRLAAERSFKLKFPLSSMVFLSRRIIIEELLNDPELQAAVDKRANETGQARSKLKQGLRRQANEMVPAFKAVFYFSIGYWLARTLLLTLYRVKLLRVSQDEYAKIGRDATVVLIMNHRSNMDVLLVNFLASRRSTIAHAAGEWARMWPLNHLVRLAGNYVVDRDSNDPLYRLLLKRYVQMAVARGIHLGIFPEGSLSRDGLPQKLNFGLLNYVATASWPGYDRDVVFIPVSFNYDRIPEQQRLVFEGEREFKHRGKLYLAINTIKFCIKFLLTPLIPRHRRFGWACCSFGEPISLKQWQRARGIELKSLSSEQRREHVEVLGRQLMHSARHIIPVLPTHVLAQALVEKPGADWPMQKLFQRCAELRSALETAGAPIFTYEIEATPADHQGLDKLQQLGLVKVSDAGTGGEKHVRAAAGKLPMLHYYANSIVHYLDTGDTESTQRNQAKESSTTAQGRKEYLRVVYESFERIQHSEHGKFIARFYQLFLASSPTIAENFRDTDMPRLHLHLQQSLEHMVDFYITQKPSARLRQIAGSHNQLGHDIIAGFYDHWLESLLLAIAEFDPKFSTEVKLSWRAVMTPGIAFMRSRYAASEKQAPQAEREEKNVAVEQHGIVRWIDHWARRAPNKIALRSPTRELSYQQLAEEVSRLSAGLHHRLGINAGDRVAFLSPNRVEFIALIFACSRLGAILVPVNFRLGSKEQRSFITRADAAAVFVDSAYLETLGDESLQCTRVVLKTNLVSHPVASAHDTISTAHPGKHILYEDLLTVPAAVTPYLGAMNSPLFIFFTSGSTGQPKGAVLTQSAVHWNALNSRVMHDLSRNDHLLTTLPFFHVGGINIQTLPALQVGATVTIMPQFDAEDFIAQVERDRHTLTVLVPTQMRQLMALPNWFSADLSSLKAVATGSTIVGKDLVQAWANKGLPIIQVYGCTESGPIAIHQTVEDSHEGLATAGYPALYTEVKLIDAQGQIVQPGHEGEICLRGPHLMSRYWGDEEATRSTLQEGWLSTGDLGYRDEQGRFHVVGRIKRLIISGGENIHPAEVEEVLEQHPDIAEAAVVGVPDPKWDEVPVALIVTLAGKPLDEAAIRSHLNQNLGRFKHPRKLLQAGALPHTSLGKIDYPKVAILLTEEGS